MRLLLYDLVLRLYDIVLRVGLRMVRFMEERLVLGGCYPHSFLE